MVDLGIEMVRAPRENDAVDMVILHELQCALALCLDVLAALCELIPRLCAGGDNFLLGNVRELFCERGGHCFQICEGHEGVAELHFAAHDLLDVVLDVLGVRGDDRAVVVVVRILKFLPLIKEGGIENKVDLLVNEPLDVPVRYFRGVTCGLGRNGLDAHLVNLVG